MRFRRQRAEERELIRARRMGPIGCLWWALVILVVLLILSALFGGFRKGSRYNGLERPGRPVVAAAPAAGPEVVSDVVSGVASGLVSGVVPGVA
jgi:hypothetical protein